MSIPVAWKNRHKGRRIFVMGTGPSLLRQDLTKLRKHNEITIGVNLICRTFVPTYLIVGDPRTYARNRNEILVQQKKTKLLLGASCGRREIGKAKGGKRIFDWPKHLRVPKGVPIIRQCNKRWDKPKTKPCFFPFMEYVCNGHTVVIDSAIALAVFLGSKQIYLLGCDCEGTGHSYNPGPVKNWIWRSSIAKILASYTTVRRVFGAMGGRIFNATAGGRLGVFERVSYDSLFGKKK